MVVRNGSKGDEEEGSDEPEVDGRFVMMELRADSQAGKIATLRAGQVRRPTLALLTPKKTSRQPRLSAPREKANALLSLNASFDRSRVSHPTTDPSLAVVNTAVLPSPAPRTRLVMPF